MRKYWYNKVIQHYSYVGWEDVCEYSQNDIKNKRVTPNVDLYRYVRSKTGAYRMITRRVLIRKKY